MLTVDTFCYCNLRTGTILILWWNMIYSVNGMLFLAITIKLGHEYLITILPVLLIGLVVSVRTLFHIAGADKNETHSSQSKNIEWLRYSCYYNASLVFALIISYLFVICQLSLQYNTSKPDIAAWFGFFFVLFSFFTGIQIYFTLVVYSYYKTIVEFEQNNRLDRAIPLTVLTAGTTANDITFQSYPYAPSAPTLPRDYSNDFVQVSTDPTLSPIVLENNCINYLH